MDTEVDLRCSGVYSYRISDPLLFYTNVAGNVRESFKSEDIDTQLKAEFVNALAPALGRIAKQGIRPSELTDHYQEITQEMNAQLTKDWAENRGLSLVSIALNPITLSQEDSDRIKAAQTAAVYSDPGMGAGVMAQATAEAMKDAANNPNGAMTGFWGMGMAQNAGGVSNLYAQAQQNQQAQPAPAMGGFAPATPAPEAAAETWNCSRCGTPNSGNFCTECGAPKPVTQIPSCTKCGFTPADINKLPKFCPQCGTKFGE